MKTGDWVEVPTGQGREKCQGILVDIRDNPQDVESYRYTQGETKVRKIVDVLSSGKIICSWAAHVKVINENR